MSISPELAQPLEDSFEHVQRLGKSRGELPRSVDELDGLVEKPLLAAAKDLYCKGVRTIESGANPESNSDVGFLVVEYDTLSDENKAIAEAMAAEDAVQGKPPRIIEEQSGDGYRVATIQVPLREGMTVQEISDNALATAQAFKTQPFLWVPKYTPEEIKDAYAFDTLEEVERDAAELGLFLGPDGKYYEDTELTRRALGQEA